MKEHDPNYILNKRKNKKEPLLAVEYVESNYGC